MDSGRLEVPSGTVNLDTVRALHQTVVSLRTALEVSKNELKQLKEKYQKHSDCIEYADVIEKLTIENHILRRKIIDSDLETTPSSQNIHLQVTYSPRRDLENLSEVFIHTATTDAKSSIQSAGTTEFGKEFEDRSVGEEIEVHDQILTSEQLSRKIDQQFEKFEQIEEGQEFCSTTESVRQLEKDRQYSGVTSSDKEYSRNYSSETQENYSSEKRYSENSSEQRFSENYSSENRSENNSSEKQYPENSPELFSENDLEKSPEENPSNELSPQNNEDQNSEVETDFQLRDDIQGTFKAKLELLSKFDVKIKVRTLKEGTILSTTTSDSESVEDKREKESRKKTKEASFKNNQDKNVHNIQMNEHFEEFFVKEKKENASEKLSKDAVENNTKVSKHFEEQIIHLHKDIKNQPSEKNLEDISEKDVANIHFEGTREHFKNLEDQRGNKIRVKAVSSDNIKMAVSNEGDTKSKRDNFDIQVRITSEENLVVKESMGCRRKDTFNLDVDNLSLRSMSEGDNSVFSEQPEAATPLEQTEAQSDDSEVDDIELIFTTGESKDITHLQGFQEDLVSIRDTEWTPHSSATQSTPVLIKFHTLDPDFQPGSEDQLQGTSKPLLELKKRVSLPNDKEINISDLSRNVVFNKGQSLDLPGRGILKSCDHRSDNMLYRKSPNTSSKRLDSVDSLSGELRGLSFDNTKSSSFEMGSSMDIMRDESMDSFHRMTHLGHRFSIFAENDISKCGISEEDLTNDVYARRNTCPNPFQYRAGPLRAVSRAPGPFKVPCGRLRPILRDGTNPRRDSAAQTDVSALPPRWGSDGYLAYKMNPPQTLPCIRSRHEPPRRLSVSRAPPRAEEGRRLLLSDIGFTSMVPELSRSAEPLCALARRAQPGSTTDMDSLATNTSKFMSRGSSHLSPSFGSEWTPTLYLPGAKSECNWRTSLPDVRRPRLDDTDELMQETDSFLRRSVDNLRSVNCDVVSTPLPAGVPYIPREPKQLRLGHAVKIITPAGRVAVGRVRYVGIAGGTPNSSVVVGAEFPQTANVGLPRNDGTHNGRRYFLTTPQCTALFVPFHKVVMAWAN